MRFPKPIFIGFRAKIVAAPNGLDIPKVCSMSDCTNQMPPDWVQRWDFNRASCYNSEEEARATLPARSEDEYTLLAYRMFPVAYTPSAPKKIDLVVRRSPAMGSPENYP